MIQNLPSTRSTGKAGENISNELLMWLKVVRQDVKKTSKKGKRYLRGWKLLNNLILRLPFSYA